MIIKVCHSVEMPLHFNKHGPKIFTNYQRVALIILYKRSKKSMRDFTNELYESLWPKWLGLREIPGKSTLHDWLSLFEMPLIRQLHKAVLADEQPKVMSLDATSLDSWQRSRHFEKRIGEPNMPYAKLDALIDTDTMLIHDFVLRMKPRHDIIGAESIFKRNKLLGVKILGDKGYDSEELHELVYEKGGTFYAPPRRSSRNRPRGRFRKRCLVEDADYPRRNCSESGFHALKQRFLPTLRCRRHYLKKREVAWIIILYNLVRIVKGNVQITKLIIFKMIAYSGHTLLERHVQKREIWYFE
jgi:transposase